MTVLTRAHAGAAFPFLPACMATLAALLALLAALTIGAPSEQDAVEAVAADVQDAVTLASAGGAQ